MCTSTLLRPAMPVNARAQPVEDAVPVVEDRQHEREYEGDERDGVEVAVLGDVRGVHRPLVGARAFRLGRCAPEEAIRRLNAVRASRSVPTGRRDDGEG